MAEYVPVVGCRYVFVLLFRTYNCLWFNNVSMNLPYLFLYSPICLCYDLKPPINIAIETRKTVWMDVTLDEFRAISQLITYFLFYSWPVAEEKDRMNCQLLLMRMPDCWSKRQWLCCICRRGWLVRTQESPLTKNMVVAVGRAVPRIFFIQMTCHI